MDEIGEVQTVAKAESPPGQWAETWSWLVAAAVTLLLAWTTYSNNGWVVLLSGVDLGFHELGHMVVMWAPDFVVWPAGSFMQVAVPLGLAAYFTWVRRDRFATILMLAWTAESLNNVSVYIYDATRLVLPLLGDVDGTSANHDWANELSTFHALGLTDPLAYFVKTLSVLLFAFALGLAVWGFARARIERYAAAEKAARLREREAALPVHEPFNIGPPEL